MNSGTVGGYDEGYRCCNCFWGKEPGSLLKLLPEFVPGIKGIRVWDAGCGEGKNAIYLARQGAIVCATDISPLAITNARTAWPDAELVQWNVKDIRESEYSDGGFDLVIMYGLLHCLSSFDEIESVVNKMQLACKPGGLHMIVAFNNRKQELHAHPGFYPTLLKHSEYIRMYDKWRVLLATDTDLHETHPHNNIPHTHSLTRIVAKK